MKAILGERDDWMTKEVREPIGGVEHSLRHVSRILRFLGMKYAKPYQHNYRRSENAKEEFKKLDEAFKQTSGKKA